MLAACGGNPETKVTVSFNDLSGQSVAPVAVAYQIGDGKWVNLWPDDRGGYSFSIPAGETRYGVAVRCSGFIEAALQSGAVYQLTTDESTSPRLPCMDFGLFSQMSGLTDVSAIPGSSSPSVLGYIGFDAHNSTSTGYSVMLPESTSAAAALLAYDDILVQNYSNLIGGRVFHGINARGSFSRDLSLQAGDTITVRQLGPFTLPAGFGSSHYGVGLFAAGGADNPHRQAGKRQP